jgi:hypothetical protein
MYKYLPPPHPNLKAVYNAKTLYALWKGAQLAHGNNIQGGDINAEFIGTGVPATGIQSLGNYSSKLT